jgi:hypothetical protein
MVNGALEVTRDNLLHDILDSVMVAYPAVL